jgi:hypothetical protein
MAMDSDIEEIEDDGLKNFKNANYGIVIWGSV